MHIFKRPWGAAAVCDGVPILPFEDNNYGTGFSFASGDLVISKDGGATSPAGTLPAETPASSKLFRFSFSATEMEAGRVVALLVDQTVPKAFEDQIVIVETEVAEGAIGGIVTTDAGNSATQFEANALGSTDIYTNLLCVFTTGNNAKAERKVTGYNTSTKILSFTTGFPNTPADGDKFVLINR